MKQGPKRALIVIDVQNEYVGGNLPIEFPRVESSLANIGMAMDAAKAASVPVVVVQNILPEGAPIMAKGTPGADLHPVVASRSREHFIAKSRPSAFSGTDLQAWLETYGIDTIAIVGYMTHNCDFSTAVEAMHAGFEVEFLSDATGSVPYANRAGTASAEDIHRIVTVVLQARFAAVMDTTEWIEMARTGAQPVRDSIFASNQRARFPGQE